MTFDEFISKYSGKKIDFDGAFQGQCVDLFRQYAKEVLEFPQAKGVSGAADFWSNYETDPVLKNNYEKLVNTLEFVPKKGDVMIWNKRVGGGFGHIAVVVTANVNEFTSFDQNWRAINVCELTDHTYSNVYGVLRPIIAEKPTGKVFTQEEYDKVRLERDKNWNLYQSEIESHQKDLDDLSVAFGTDRGMSALLARAKAIEDERQADHKTIKGLEAEKEKLVAEKADLVRQIEELSNRVDQQQIELEREKKQNETILQQLDALKEKVTQTQKKESFLDKLLAWLKG